MRFVYFALQAVALLAFLVLLVTADSLDQYCWRFVGLPGRRFLDRVDAEGRPQNQAACLPGDGSGPGAVRSVAAA